LEKASVQAEPDSVDKEISGEHYVLSIVYKRLLPDNNFFLKCSKKLEM